MLCTVYVAHTLRGFTIVSAEKKSNEQNKVTKTAEIANEIEEKEKAKKKLRAPARERERKE